MKSPFEGKSVVVTGAAGGIGAAAAAAFATAGANVLVVDRSEESGQQTVEKILADGGSARFQTGDVANEESVAEYVAKAVEHFRGIDVFFNNAGIEGKIVPVVDYAAEDFDRVIAVNLRGMFLGMKHVLKVMLPAKSGSIVNNASVSGLRGAAGMCAYIASKHGILGLTKTAAIEVASSGVRVNAICPGPIETRMMHSIEELTSPGDPGKVATQVLARNPTGRYGTPEEVAQTVMFLASPAASYINGVALPVDGGRMAF
ncbi:MAG: SDR family NAD(P)-dependent oxidoreductase [Chthoniobacterales bacterium]